MLSKKVDLDGLDWDHHLPYVLFAYRASVQESTQESPFFLLHGRDPRLPSTVCLDPTPDRQDVELCSYSSEVAEQMQEAWDIAKSSIGRAQAKQKGYYDRNTKPPRYRKGQRVFVYMPSAKQGKVYKFARPFHGPFRVVDVYDTGVSVRPIDSPDREVIRVSFSRLRHCPE